MIFESNDGLSRTLATGLALFSDIEVLDVARTHAKALELLEKHRQEWYVVVVDLSSMAGMALVVVLRACESRLAHQLVMVLATDTSVPLRSMCTTLGADFVFGKETGMDEFFSICKRLGVRAEPFIQSSSGASGQCMRPASTAASALPTPGSSIRVRTTKVVTVLALPFPLDGRHFNAFHPHSSLKMKSPQELRLYQASKQCQNQPAPSASTCA